ncbi:MAG: glycosyltransferase [Nitrospiraceae bacterium]|nr:glycosyltransferase [Nitrospiraceae bacterium]
MRIGFDITPLTRNRSGVGNFCYYLLKHLLQLGGGVQFEGLATRASRGDLGELAGRIVHRRVPLPTRVLYKMWGAFGIPRADALLGGVDVYHATNYFLPPTRSAKRVVTFYDLAFLTMPGKCSPKIVGPFARHTRRAAQEADAILTCSESSKKDIVRLLAVPPGKVTVTYGAVDEDFVPVERDRAARMLAKRHGIQGPFILFVSTIEPRKNVPTLLRAFKQIAGDIPHTLVLAGATGWNSDDIPKIIDGLELNNRVVRTGFVASRADLAAFYSAADLFAFPTLYEGFGLPLLEAMTCGCPVVSARNSSVPEVVGDAAVLVDDATDAGAVAQAMAGVLADPAQRDVMRAKGLEQAKRFSWETCAQQTMQVYQELAP